MIEKKLFINCKLQYATNEKYEMRTQWLQASISQSDKTSKVTTENTRVKKLLQIINYFLILEIDYEQHLNTFITCFQSILTY